MHREPGLVLGPALAGLLTSIVWGSLAFAAGLRGRFALAIAAGMGASMFVYAALAACADALGEMKREDSRCER